MSFLSHIFGKVAAMFMAASIATSAATPTPIIIVPTPVIQNIITPSPSITSTPKPTTKPVIKAPVTKKATPTPPVYKPLSQEEISVVNNYIASLDKDIEETNNLIIEIRQKDGLALDVVEDYSNNVSIVRNTIYAAFNDALSIPKNSDIDRQIMIKSAQKYEEIKTNYDIRLKQTFSNEARRLQQQTAIIQDQIRAYDIQSQQQAIQQSQAALNQAAEQAAKREEIMKAARENGVTEAVVNAQLEAAGLIKQTTCSFSAVGGMTPGAGSMICY